MEVSSGRNECQEEDLVSFPGMDKRINTMNHDLVPGWMQELGGEEFWGILCY